MRINRTPSTSERLGSSRSSDSGQLEAKLSIESCSTTDPIIDELGISRSSYDTQVHNEKHKQPKNHAQDLDHYNHVVELSEPFWLIKLCIRHHLKILAFFISTYIITLVLMLKNDFF